jgi:hydroxyacylglutathione hydrolase
MIILTNSGGIAMTNCFLIADETTREAVLFDAPDHTIEPLLLDAARRGWKLVGLWLTHGHFDHFAVHALVHKHFPDA